MVCISRLLNLLHVAHESVDPILYIAVLLLVALLLAAVSVRRVIFLRTLIVFDDHKCLR